MKKGKEFLFERIIRCLENFLKFRNLENDPFQFLKINSLSCVIAYEKTTEKYKKMDYVLLLF